MNQNPNMRQPAFKLEGVPSVADQRLVRHTVAARVASMESEKLYLQNLCGELNLMRLSVKDRIEAIDRQIIAEKASMPNVEVSHAGPVTPGLG